MTILNIPLQNVDVDLRNLYHFKHWAPNKVVVLQLQLLGDYALLRANHA